MKNYYCFFRNSVCKKILGAALILFGIEVYAQSDYIVTTTSDSGPGSLREAITLANSDAIKDNIYFNISGEGPHQIIVQSSLPEINEPVIIDGTSQPGYSWDSPNIVINGNGAAINGLSLFLNSSGSVIKGLVINGFGYTQTYNTLGIGIYIKNTGNHTISGNYLGIAADGNTKVSNRKGILLENSSGNIIGGDLAGDRNVISGNFTGVFIDGGYQYSLISELNRIIGNFIGTNSLGTERLSNHIGINLRNANNNIIGGRNQGEKNIISGNDDTGINIMGHHNEILGNLIGINLNGSPVPNLAYGLKIVGQEANTGPLSIGNIIGGSEPDAGNIISGNGQGVLDNFSNGSIYHGNHIGADITGTISIPNSSTGIELNGENFQLGGPNLGEGNLISTNGGFAQISTAGKFGKIQGNLIGTDASGEAPLSLTQGSQGIFSYGGESILLGGVNEGEGNVIAGNGYAEVDLELANNWNIYNNIIGFEDFDRNDAVVRFDASKGNNLGGTQLGMPNIIRGGNRGVLLENNWDWAGYITQIKISGNSIYSNNSIGIDIMPLELNANDQGDSDSGSNLKQNFPVISNDAALEAGIITLSYFVDSAPGNSSYPIQVEFFIDDGTRQGKEYLFYDLFTEADFNAGIPKEINVPLPTGSSFVAGDSILSTATDAGGNTSEFGASVEVAGTCSGPVAVCKDAFILVLGPDGLANLTVQEVDNGSTASCGLQSITIDKTKFSCTDIGDNIVTLSVTDVIGVTATCTTTVTVQDNLIPELTFVLDKEVSVDENCQFTIPDYTSETLATDNCANPIITQEPPIGTILSGHSTIQEIILKADDNNGNTNTTKFLITLKDTSAPELSFIADKEEILNENCIFIIPNYLTEVTATDNCFTPNLIQTPEAGSEISGSGTVQEISITADDGNGNSSSISFVVTLKDGTSPSISSIQNQTVIADENCEAILKDYSSFVTVSDNCDLDLIITQEPTAGTIINSDTVVTLTVKDNTQNSSSTSFTVLLEGGTTNTYYLDNDDDGYGVDSTDTNLESCVEPESGFSTIAGDCNDNDPTIYPGAFDVRGDGIDQDCNGVDEPLDCIGTDTLDITQMCPENSTVETWMINNPSTCSVEVRWEIKNTTLYGYLIASPGDNFFNTPITSDKKTIIIIHWKDKNGQDKRRTIVSKGTDCSLDGTFSEYETTSSEVEVSVYPNPIADNGFWISFPPEVENQTFQGAIYNLNGQLLIQQNFKVPSGGGELFWEIDHDYWAEGLYPLVLTGNSQQFKITLVK